MGETLKMNISRDQKKLARAEAIIEMLRIFYPNQVSRAENLADLAMRTPDNTAPEVKDGSDGV